MENDKKLIKDLRFMNAPLFTMAADRIEEFVNGLEEIDEYIEEYLESAKIINKQFPNSFGAGQEIGAVDGLRKAKSILLGEEE